MSQPAMDNDALSLKLWERRLQFEALRYGHICVPGWFLSYTSDHGLRITREKVLGIAETLDRALHVDALEAGLSRRTYQAAVRARPGSQTLAAFVSDHLNEKSTGIGKKRRSEIAHVVEAAIRRALAT